MWYFYRVNFFFLFYCDSTSAIHKHHFTGTSLIDILFYFILFLLIEKLLFLSTIDVMILLDSIDVRNEYFVHAENENIITNGRCCKFVFSNVIRHSWKEITFPFIGTVRLPPAYYQWEYILFLHLWAFHF